ncbi:hypothetical protein FA10DRAFT_265663 [Acaromyces ingoldii]|uniref:Altered inheritance of mitochondria protein 21 n=1 Tax=Acaromyces ingoldii TaxID=215250 RepID=A0A316YSL8_9BASI|nr:hypothetical protein FA10DRAFT_265663 [Acaromyces ingoldii]PWN91824.1 hypothetical protein FA10DRAFT_265663 [Acaromyces ingoldii]
MSDKSDSPRRPTNMPSGASSLSERIAALQRKSSASGGQHPRSTSDSSSRGANLSPSGSPSRSFSGSGGVNSQGVRDRITRFQTQAQTAGEKPLLPRSAFGQGAGADGSSNRVLKPYPGANAAGSGSGAWGEGVLRPQLTGGTWVGGGNQGGWSDGIRPQNTGGTHGLSQFRTRGSPSPSPSLPRTPGAGKDAFLELDEPSSPTAFVPRPDHLRRGSSFSEAQMAAASAGLRRPTRNGSSTVGDGTTSEAGASSVTDSDVANLTDVTSTSSSLPKLPDAPQIELDGGAAPAAPQDPTVPKLPSPPSDTPVSPAKSAGRQSLSSDVEIGVSGASPAKMAALRRSLSGTGPEEQGGEGSGVAEEVEGRVPTPMGVDEVAAARADDPAEGIGRLALDPGSGPGDDESDDGHRGPLSTVQPSLTATDLPSRAQVERTSSGRVDAQDPQAHEVMGPGLLVPQDAVASADAKTHAAAAASEKKKDHEQEQEPESKGNDTTAANGENGHLSSPSSKGAAAKAREAIATGRSKSIRRPPPGRMMSAAEMDASDDEYEPGWASVISRS